MTETNTLSISDLSIEDLSETIAIVDVPEHTKAWFVRGGKKSKFWNDFNYNGYIGIDREGIENFSAPEGQQVDLSAVQTKYRDELYAKSVKHLQNAGVDAKTIESKKRSIKVSAGRRASVLRTFRHEMQIGDLILCPGKSTKEFLIGIVKTNASIEKIKHIETPESYDVSPFDNIRRVSWIKKVSIFDIPQEIQFIKHGNGAMFNITDHIDVLLPIFFNYYFYDAQFNMRIDVATKRTITSQDLYNLQGVIIKSADNPQISFAQKTKIASPGHILLTTIADPVSIEAGLRVLQGLGIGGFVALVLTNGDKVASLLGLVRDWSHNKNMNKIEEASQHMKLLNAADSDSLSDEQRADLDRERLAVIQKFKITDDSIGVDINSDNEV